jgi:coproporphyrinogen III oxidase-like Fe-S oxidoreductase
MVSLGDHFCTVNQQVFHQRGSLWHYLNTLRSCRKFTSAAIQIDVLHKTFFGIGTPDVLGPKTFARNITLHSLIALYLKGLCERKKREGERERKRDEH